MADAEAGDLEDEDRVAVPDHLAAGIVGVIAADVGGDVADVDVADAFRDQRRLAVVAPAVQHVRDAAVGKQRVMRAVRPVHGDDVGQAAGAIGAAVVGRDPHAARGLDVIGRMASIGDGDLFGLRRDPPKTDRRGARRRIRHRQALAALGLLGAGRRHQPTQHGNDDREGSQHGKSCLKRRPERHCIAESGGRHGGIHIVRRCGWRRGWRGKLPPAGILARVSAFFGRNAG